MGEEPHLRVVPERAPRPGSRPAVPPRRIERGLVAALAVALVITAGLLVWSRSQLGAAIAELEARVGGLQAELDRRERTLAAHQRRLDDVRARLRELATLAESPVPEQP